MLLMLLYESKLKPISSPTFIDGVFSGCPIKDFAIWHALYWCQHVLNDDTEFEISELHFMPRYSCPEGLAQNQVFSIRSINVIAIFWL